MLSSPACSSSTCTSLAPHCPRMSSNSNTLLELLIFSPRLGHESFFLAEMGQMGQGSPWCQAVFPPGPTKSNSQLFCAGVLLPAAAWRDMTPQVPHAGDKSIWPKPRWWEQGWGQAEATCVVCHICKESMAQGEHCQHQAHLLYPGSPSLCLAPVTQTCRGRACRQPLCGEE